MTDAVTTALIAIVPIMAGQWWSYRLNSRSRHRSAATTNEKVDSVHELANSRLSETLSALSKALSDIAAFRTEIRRLQAELDERVPPSRIVTSADGKLTPKADIL